MLAALRPTPAAVVAFVPTHPFWLARTDAKVDLVLIASTMVRVLFNDGRGAFPTSVALTGTDPWWSLALGDVNGDAKPDLVLGVAVMLDKQSLYVVPNGCFAGG